MILDKTIVALDQMSLVEIDQFLSRPENSISFVKIGLELYMKFGQDIIHKINRDYKKKIFLDLKLHDIPITVERAIHSLKNLPIDFLTIHLSGGEEMLKHAIKEAKESLPNCKILGVSFLTSLEKKDFEEIFAITNLEDAFIRLFKLANHTQLDGVICSPHEIQLLKRLFPELLAITPGIRFSDEIGLKALDDQKRVSSPQEAIELGADFLVIGRSLTKARDLSARIKELSH